MKNKNLEKPRGTLQFPIESNTKEMKYLIEAEKFLRKAGEFAKFILSTYDWAKQFEGD